MKYKVTMVCREIWRAEVVIVSDEENLEAVKDATWAKFDAHKSKALEQDNYTKVETVE